MSETINIEEVVDTVAVKASDKQLRKMAAKILAKVTLIGGHTATIGRLLIAVTDSDDLRVLDISRNQFVARYLDGQMTPTEATYAVGFARYTDANLASGIDAAAKFAPSTYRGVPSDTEDAEVVAATILILEEGKMTQAKMTAAFRTESESDGSATADPEETDDPSEEMTDNQRWSAHANELHAMIRDGYDPSKSQKKVLAELLTTITA